MRGELFPVIVLEGPDGVGKTTLADKLVKSIGAKYVHLTYRWPSKMFHYHSSALFYCLRLAQKQPVVLDRWWPSEVVYADAYRGGSKWPLAYRMFEKAALRHAFTYVLCLPEDRKAYLEHYNRLKGRREEMYNEGMERVYDGFQELFNNLWNCGRPYLVDYDFMKRGDKLDRVVQEVTEVAYDALRMDPRFFHDFWFMNLTGTQSLARYLFVGDELNPKTRREVWPFFDYGRSSLYLAELLHNFGVPEHHLMFMNSRYVMDQPKSDHILKTLNDSDVRVIAMGRKASDRLWQLNIREFRQIHHPQYYARFDSAGGVKAFNEVLT